MAIKTTTMFRPVVVCNGKQRPLSDREVDTVAQNAMEEAVKADAEKFGKAEGYVLAVFQAERVKEGKK